MNIALLGVGGVGKTTFANFMSGENRGESTVETINNKPREFLQQKRGKMLDCKIFDFRGQDPRKYVKGLKQRQLKLHAAIFILAIYEVEKDKADKYQKIPVEKEKRNAARKSLHENQSKVYSKGVATIRIRPIKSAGYEEMLFRANLLFLLPLSTIVSTPL